VKALDRAFDGLPEDGEPRAVSDHVASYPAAAK
jgi:hypothetical protein